MIRLPYIEDGETRIGLVDLKEGGLPTSGNHPLDIADLTKGTIHDFQIRSMTPLLDDNSGYYGEFLEGVSVGYVRPSMMPWSKRTARRSRYSDRPCAGSRLHFD